MEIQHEIVAFNKETGSILVRYYTEENQIGLNYNIDLPIIDGKYPTQEEITAQIKFMEPRGQLERTIQVAAVEVPSFLEALIPAPAPIVEPAPVEPTIPVTIA